jgi:hypothetical protein
MQHTCSSLIALNPFFFYNFGCVWCLATANVACAIPTCTIALVTAPIPGYLMVYIIITAIFICFCYDMAYAAKIVVKIKDFLWKNKII